jgi:hypothetical protein
MAGVAPPAACRLPRIYRSCPGVDRITEDNPVAL